MRPAETIIILLMLLLNAVFAAYELALASVSVARLKELVAAKRPGAQAALRMKNRMEASLAVVQLGITLVGAVAAAVGGARADEAIAPWLQSHFPLSDAVAAAVALAIVILPLSAITIIAGELVPKTLAIRNADWVCLKLSPIMKWFAISVYPVVLGLEWITKRVVWLVQKRVDREPGREPVRGLAELLTEAKALRLNRVISEQQARVIEGAGALSHATVGDILVPPKEIRMLHADGKLTEHLVTVHLEAHTRFPVTQTPGDPEGIIGYVNVKDVFFLAKTHPEDPSLRKILRPLMDLPPGAKIGEALGRMTSEHFHLALVRDTGGRVMGMVAMEDVLEVIVGDMQDEFDRLPRNLTRAGDGWIAGGGVPLSRLREVLSQPGLGESLPGDTALNDWIAASHPTQLQAGDAMALGGIHVLVRKVRRMKVMEALVSIAGV